LASIALQLPINAAEAGAGLVPPAVATELMGKTGAFLILVMLFMAIASTGSSESIAVATLVAHDIYREYFNPMADGEQILFTARLVVVLFGVFMGCFSIILFEMGLNLGWVYLFMGVVIGSAVAPLWNLLTWKKASGTGAVLAAWAGLFFGLLGWVLVAKFGNGVVTIDTLGTNSAMLSGNLISILSSAFIHYFYSVYIDPQDYDFSQLDRKIRLVEDDKRGLTEAQKDPEVIKEAESWVNRRAYVLTFVLVVAWPVLSIPAGVFSESYFAFWILIAAAWGFSAAMAITFLPLLESSDEIDEIFRRILNHVLCRQGDDIEAREQSELLQHGRVR
jgi:urea-proton symporter